MPVHTEQPSERRRRTERRPFRTGAFALGLLAASAAGIPAAHAAPPVSPNELPIPQGGYTADAFTPSGFTSGAWVTSGGARARIEGRVLDIQQQTERAILNWRSFNIGRDNTVNFDQPSSTAIALNRIFQNDPSRILGALTADGQVFLVNQNGIVFGEGARVNTNTLVASTLDIADDIFNEAGIIGALQLERAAFEGDGRVVVKDQDGNTLRFAVDQAGEFQRDAEGNLIPDPDGQPFPVEIRIERAAELETDAGGRIMVFAPSVVNDGRLESPEGQVILAGATDKVFLAASDDPDLRGLLVEVDTGGTVTNERLGSILSERGNVTLLGHAVNQDGLVRATTSVNVNGSIRLLARDRAEIRTVPGGGAFVAEATETGAVSLGSESITEVVPELDDPQTAVDAQPQPVSSVGVMGDTVRLRGGASISAPGGAVELTATRSPANPVVPGGADNDTRIRIEPGARIDVSGTDSTVLPMERNLVEVELRGNELRDAPVQRDGPLRGETIVVDVREGTPLADISGQVDAIGRTVGERTATGGTIRLRAEGDVVVEDGATLDFSGGLVSFQGGVLQTTKLISEGRIFDISEADPSRRFDGIFGQVEVRNDKFGMREIFEVFPAGTLAEFEPGYVEGKDAGALEVVAGGVVLDGRLLGNATAGRFQRRPPQSLAANAVRPFDQVPLRGRLRLGDPLAANPRIPDVVFTREPPALNLGPDEALPEDRPLFLPADLFATGGLNRITVLSGGRVEVPENVELELAPGGEVEVVATEVAFNGELDAPAADVSLTARLTGPGQPSLVLGRGSVIDVRGMWVNDTELLNPQGATGPVFVDGGRVRIEGTGSSGEVRIEQGSRIDAGGGARLRADSSVEAGGGGDVSVVSDFLNATELVLDGDIRGLALERGGSLSLLGSGFVIGEGPGTAPGPALSLDPGFFERFGFTAHELTATHTGIAVSRNVSVPLRARNLELTGGFNTQPTGADLRGFTRETTLPELERVPVSLAMELASEEGASPDARVEVGEGAALRADPGGRIALASDTTLVVDGTLAAPAGDIELTVNPGEGGFRADQAIWLGPAGRLLAPAVAQLEPNDLGLRRGRVLDGGTVTLTARRGYVVTNPGSLIDVSGTEQVLDLRTALDDSPSPGLLPSAEFAPRTVVGQGGAIELVASEGVFPGGELRGRPGDGPGAGGGRLSVRLDTLNRGSVDPGLTPLPVGPRDIVLGVPELPDLPARQPIPAELNGFAFLNPDQVREGGFSELRLRTQPIEGSGEPVSDDATAAIRFDGPVALDLESRLILDAPVLASSGEQTELGAAYVGLGSSNRRFQLEPAPSLGPGRLRVEADFIDLVGTTSLQGFGGDDGSDAVMLSSAGDIRLRGLQDLSRSGAAQAELTGAFASAADLTLRADQVFASTLSDFTVSVTRPGGRLTVAPGGAAAPPLSAGSRVALAATEVVQAGVVRAPFGEIVLGGDDGIAGEQVELRPGSVTSTSGAGQRVLFGRTQFGQDIVLPLTGFTRVVDAPPQKRVAIDAARVDVAPGAVADLAGGGDLLAPEFVPGPGGSTDILAADNPAGSFAILPGLVREFAPFDPLDSPPSGIEPGETIRLAGGEGLPEGEFAVLPARFALLPDARLLTPVEGTQDLVPGEPLTRLDGAPVVAGRRGVAGADIEESRWSGFAVLDGEAVRERAEFRETLAGEFFAENAEGGIVPELPDDAGSLSVSAGDSLRLAGSIRAGAAGGRGARVDVLADDIAVVERLSRSAQGVELLASDLEALGAESLLVGGRRSTTEAGVAVDVVADQVRVGTGAEIVVPEILLTAKDSVSVGEGARLSAAGRAVETPGATLSLTGDSAVARLSTGEQVRVERTGARELTGTLAIDAGAELSAQRSITLDASLDARSEGTLRTDGGSLSLGASRVSLGATEDVTEGLALSSAELAALQAQELRLTSRSTVDLLGGFDARFGAFEVDAAGFAGRNAPGEQVRLEADRITLANTRGAEFAAAPAGSGRLTLAADELRIREGELAVEGFGETALEATGAITAEGQVDLRVSGGLEMNAARLGASGGSDVTVSATEPVRLGAGGAAGTGPAEGLGARLDIAGTEVSLEGAVVLPSGEATLRATGAGGAVSLAPGAVVDVAGREERFGDVRVGTPGGRVNLVSDSGSVRIAEGARVDVSGAAGADAGFVQAEAAQGELRLAGARLQAGAGGGAEGGTFRADASALPEGFSALNQVLDEGGFTRGLDLRVRSENVLIAAQDRVTAREVELAADAGDIRVAGRIDASAPQGGDVRLNAGGDLTLLGGARIDARATAPEAEGGRVFLASAGGEVDAELSGSGERAVLDVTGTRAGGASGTVRFTAPRTGGDDIALADGVAERVDVRGAGRIEAEAVRVREDGFISGADVSELRAETESFMQPAVTGAIAGRLGFQDNAAFRVVPGIEVRSAGDLTVAPAGGWDLLAWADQGQPGVLTLRAAGDLRLDQTLSDGVAPRQVDLGGGFLTAPRDSVQTGLSWSFNLVGGADLAGANRLATTAAGGDVRVGSGVQVRTGTGDIQVAAGGDVRLADASSVIVTVGENRGPGVLDPTFAEILLTGDFVENGGDIRIAAHGDVRGAPSRQLFSEWQPRIGGDETAVAAVSDVSAAWAVSPGNFRQNVGALGGGDVTVRAGGDIDNLSVAIPTTGQPTGELGTQPDVAGGGTLLVEASGDIRSGMFHVGRGSGELRAGGEVTAAAGSDLHPVLALGDARLDVQARRGIELESVLNPTALPLSPNQGASLFPGAPPIGGAPEKSFFFTFADDSEVGLTALSGDIVLRNEILDLQTLSPDVSFDSAAGEITALRVYPGTVRARSLGGDLFVRGDMTLFPSPQGTLEWLADGDIAPARDLAASTRNINLSDADRSLLPRVTAPASSFNQAGDLLTPAARGVNAPVPVHLGDPEPSRIVARRGSVGSADGERRLTLRLAEPARVGAGEDVRNLNLVVQNVEGDDVSVVEAGRDVVFRNTRDNSGRLNPNVDAFRIDGPGRLDVLAGRDVDLGTAVGFESLGDTRNPALPEQGAGITVLAGLTADPKLGALARDPAHAAVVERFSGQPPAFRERLLDVVLEDGGRSREEVLARLADFDTLPEPEQRSLALDLFFAELRVVGTDATASGSNDFSQAFAAIDTLFPRDDHEGDLSLLLSRITTVDGGDIDLAVPGGLVNAGVATSDELQKEPAELGIVAQREGDIRAHVLGGFLVNQSRVFALNGGDVLIFSEQGDIDAGRGAKTALSVPPPAVTFDEQGNTIVEFPPAISGSGIRTAAQPGTPPGSVFLFAPAGTVRAGDAGIEAAGDVLIAAREVVGAENIAAGGVTVGVPTVSTVSVSTGLTSASSAATAASKAAEETSTDRMAGDETAEAAAAAQGPSVGFIRVDVLGFGPGDDEESRGEREN